MEIPAQLARSGLCALAAMRKAASHFSTMHGDSNGSIERFSPGKRDMLGRALWASGGFAAGIAFWHVIGFWMLVQSAVFGYAGGEFQRPATVVRSASVPLETGSIDRSRRAQSGCITLALERDGGRTYGLTCGAKLIAPTGRHRIQKQDRE